MTNLILLSLIKKNGVHTNDLLHENLITQKS
jgi:hypothetical protein